MIMDKRINYIEFESAAADGLSRVHWGFFLNGSQLVVDTYTVWSRQSKRHKEKIVASWSRLNSRDSTLKIEDVPFTPEIAAGAKALWLMKLEAVVTVGFQGAPGVKVQPARRDAKVTESGSWAANWTEVIRNLPKYVGANDGPE
ncbi:hypothetical protein [Ralstonia pseudosolanacearum]|uniref:hypothetical protein n=1 Tax=Ralstonia pseudosolanacearum TaxID=1310165 RepID=UPI003CECCB3F